MRVSIGGAWLYGLVLVFVLLFTAFLTITLNFSKAYRIKNEIIDFLERNEGITFNQEQGKEGSISLINNYLISNNQVTKGSCPIGWYGAEVLTSPVLTESNDDLVKYFYCINKVKINDIAYPNAAYYEIYTFFKFNIPVLGNITTINVRGETTKIALPADCDYFFDICDYTNNNVNQNQGIAHSISLVSSTGATGPFTYRLLINSENSLTVRLYAKNARGDNIWIDNYYPVGYSGGWYEYDIDVYTSVYQNFHIIVANDEGETLKEVTIR